MVEESSSNKSTIKDKSNGELLFLDTSFKHDNGKILYWYIGSLYMLTIPTLQLSPPKKLQSVVSSWFNGAYSMITNKDDLTKENTRINQGLKNDRYQEKNVKSLRELLTIPACLSQLKSHRLCSHNLTELCICLGNSLGSLQKLLSQCCFI